MYIALRWLVGLSVAMWIAMCILDPHKGRKKFSEGKEEIILNKFKNATAKYTPHPIVKSEIKLRRKGHQDPVLIHYGVVFVGVLTIYLAPGKAGFASFMKLIKAKITTSWKCLTNNIDFEVGAIKLFEAFAKMLQLLREIRNTLRIPYVFQSLLIVRDNTENKINVVLMTKIKEIIEEKRSLSQLLMTAMNENKSLKFQYQLETIAKHKLLRSLKDVNKQPFTNFRHLYVLTRQENIFLKSSMKKITRERDEVERNLITLINKVYCSNNSDLKVFCSRMVVNTKKNLLSSNAGEEIMKFLSKSQCSNESCMDRSHKNNDYERNLENKFLCINTQTCVQTNSRGDRPQLINQYTEVPTNFFWTVKNKDGIVEKLYEYNYSPDYNGAGKIRNIREYAVYFDKDCPVNDSIPTIEPKQNSHKVFGKDYRAICNNKFLTGSDEFRRFMANRKTKRENRF